MVPSGRTTRCGGSTVREEAIPKTIITRNAYDEGSLDQFRLEGFRCPTEWRTHDISRGCHGIQMTLLKVDREGDDGTDERTKLEDGPKDTESLAFILLERVAHHNASLGRPEQGGGDTEECTGKNQEPARALGLVTSGREELADKPSCSDQSHTPREHRRREHNPRYPGFVNSAGCGSRWAVELTRNSVRRGPST
jgi:hypothetical protein